MVLERLSETGAADWIVRSTTEYWQLLEFGPDCFEAYARLRYIPDPTRPGQAEGDVGLVPEHPSDLFRYRLAVEVLGDHTGTPGELFFCWWEGHSESALPPGATGGPKVTTTHRDYALFRGTLADVRGTLADVRAFVVEPRTSDVWLPPAFTWPADHRWVVASDVDPHFAGIGADRRAVEALVDDPRLDVVPALPQERQPHYS